MAEPRTVLIAGRKFRIGAWYKVARSRPGRGPAARPKRLQSFDPDTWSDRGGKAVVVTRGGTPTYFAGSVWAAAALDEIPVPADAGRDLDAEASLVRAALSGVTGDDWRVYVFPESPNGEPAFAIRDDSRPDEDKFSTVLNPDEDGWRALLLLARREAGA